MTTASSSLLSGVGDAGGTATGGNIGAVGGAAGVDSGSTGSAGVGENATGAAVGTSTSAATDGGATATGQGAGDSGGQSVEGQTDAAGKDQPVEYTDFTVPEGVSLNAELLGEYKGIAKELGIAQEGAQKLVDLGVKLSSQILASQEAARVAEVSAWADAAKSDKEFGGDKLPENLAVARKALDAFATPELKAYLDKSGLGNHPELIRAFFKAGKLISEDRLIPGSVKPAGAGKSAASVLYGAGHNQSLAEKLFGG